MDRSRWKQIDELVDAALDLPEAERQAFIIDRSGGDEELSHAVLELVAAHGESDAFLQHSAMKVVAKALAEESPVRPGDSMLGRTISTYRIEKLLGAGGMGEVYLAFDEKLNRRVALKILPVEYGQNDERVKRFELEARAISSINHPNIVTIYDVGSSDGINFIATELVDGKTLRDLTGGKFKLRNVMANSIQICDALSAAHAEGIIHRDIKPENIMIRKDGYAKILDFGVAKLTEIGEGNAGFGYTTKGVIIGTPAYMSPAQIAGDPVDERTDIWSCGVVLYEFITGTNPFKGSSRQETFEAILSKTAPPASSFNPEVPPELDRILAKIFSREPNGGYASASDLRADLRAIKRELDSIEPSDASGESVQYPGLRARRRRWPWALAAGVLLGTAAGLVWAFLLRDAGSGTEWTRARNQPLTDQSGIEYFPSLSPDGKNFVYAGETNDQFDIFSQRVAGKLARNLTPDSPANDTQPAYSPDGEQIAFRSERDPSGIYVMTEGGENVRRISDVGFHPSWSPDGKQIVVSTFGRDQPTVRAGANQALLIIDVQSGERRRLLEAEATFPTWSPNGKRIAYWFYSLSQTRRDIATIPVEGGEPVVITADFAVSNWNPVWSPDGRFLYFVSSRSGSLNFWRVGIDESSGQVVGEPEPVTTPSRFSRHLNFSRDGKRMIYVQTNDRSNIQGVEFDMKTVRPVGEPFWITEGERQIARPELSPDGTRFAMRVVKLTQDDIMTVSRDGRDWRDVTNDEPFDRYSRWSPDGRQIALYSDRGESGEIWMANSDGTNLRQLTFHNTPNRASSFPSFSPDGRHLSYENDGAQILDLTRPWNEQTPRKLPVDPPIEAFVPWDWSPDGKKIIGQTREGRKRFLSFFSLESNSYTRLFELSAIPVAWLPDSRHVVYGTGNKIVLVDTSTGRREDILTLSLANPRTPFVSKDGKLLYFSASSTESNIWMLDLTDEK